MESSSIFDVFRQLDVFPKVLPSFYRTSTSGGTVSLLVYIIIAWFIVQEFMYNRTQQRVLTFNVDRRTSGTLPIHLDVVFAMKCAYIDSDVIDVAGNTVHLSTTFTKEDVHFELADNQKAWIHKHLNIDNLSLSQYSLFQWRYLGEVLRMPPPDDSREVDGCRFQGIIEVARVAGNLHFTIGRSVQTISGHAHASHTVPRSAVNFTHRFNYLSFGKPINGLSNPLDNVGSSADEEKAKSMIYQYFVNVVSTSYQDVDSDAVVHTNQYSVNSIQRPVSMDDDIPGVFIKYDLDPIVFNVQDQHKPLGEFLVGLCGIIGGVFVLSGLLVKFLNFFRYIIDNRSIESNSKYRLFPSTSSHEL